MTQLDSRASISIFQLVFYTPALVAATLLCLKHGFGRSSGWLFLLTVSLCRIAGGATQLATYSDPSQGLFEASAILGSFGLSALLLASLGFLSRAKDSILSSSSVALPALSFRLVQLITTIGLILSIVGDTDISLDPQTHTLTIPTETKAGVIILVAAWILVTLIAIQLLRFISRIAQAERLLVWAVLVCLPFLLIRLVYAILVIFLNDSNFSLIFPSTVVVWTLSTIEECFVVFIYLLVGFKVPKIPKAATAIADEREPITAQQKDRQGNTTGFVPLAQRDDHQPRGIRWRGSIILTLVGMVSDLFASRKSEPVQEMPMHRRAPQQ